MGLGESVCNGEKNCRSSTTTGFWALSSQEQPGGIPQAYPSILLRVPQLRTGAPCSHQRTWAENDGRSPPKPFVPDSTHHSGLAYPVVPLAAPSLAGEQNRFILGRPIHRSDRTSVVKRHGPRPVHDPRSSRTGLGHNGGCVEARTFSPGERVFNPRKCPS